MQKRELRGIGLELLLDALLSSADLQELVVRADQILRQARNNPTFARSFAYISGPAYGALLDLSGTAWRNEINNNADFGLLLRKRYAISPAKADESSAKNAATTRYDGEEIIAIETRHELKRQQEITAAKKKFIEGAVLVLPLSPNVNYSYDPNDVFGIDASNTVYPNFRLVDEWGILEVTDGAWVVRDASGHPTRAQVPVPANTTERPLNGKGWTLELRDGWSLVPGDRPGDLTLKKGS